MVYGSKEKNEGRKEGRKEGNKEGRKEGKKEGRKEGIFCICFSISFFLDFNLLYFFFSRKQRTMVKHKDSVDNSSSLKVTYLARQTDKQTGRQTDRQTRAPAALITRVWLDIIFNIP